MDSYHTAIYQNLKLLVQIYPKLDMESRLQEGMLKKPNTRGMQSIFYSLITILDPEYCRHHVPWPISFQSDSYKFRIAVTNFLKTECPEFEPPQLLPSLLNKVDGDKYVKLVFDFVNYVTKTVLERRSVATLSMPNVIIDESESSGIFERSSASFYKRICSERQSSIELHKEMLKNGSTFIDFSSNEKKVLLKQIFLKKEEIYTELSHVLSYANVNEKKTIDRTLLDYHESICELRKNYLLVQQNTRRILMRKEHLLRLIYLQTNFNGSIINNEYLKTAVSHIIANAINGSSSTILNSLFEPGDSGLINLKEFVSFGYFLLRSRQRRILDSKVFDEHDQVQQKANNIFRIVTEKMNDLKYLDEALEKNISEYKKILSNIRNRQSDNESSVNNESLVETLRLLMSMGNYCPEPLVNLPEEALCVDITEAPESVEDIIARVKGMMKKNPV